MLSPTPPMNPQAESSLSLTTLSAFGALGLPLAMLGIPVYLLLPNYYADQFGLSLATIGLALLLARSLDVITDPIIGWLSDRFHGRISRIKQIFVATLILIASLYFLFLPNNPINNQFAIQVNGGYLFFWSFVVYLAWTWVQIPYQTLLAEITHDAHQKTRLAANRELFGIFGLLLATALPAILAVEPQSNTLFATLWGLLLLLLVLTNLSLAKLTPAIDHYYKQQMTTYQTTATLDHQPKAGILQIWQHPIRLKTQQPQLFVIMPSFFLNNLANAFPATLFILFVSDYLDLSANTGIFLIAYFLAGIIALPFWLFLAKRYGKLVTWRASILLAIIGFSGVFWLNSGDFTAYLIICLVTGLSLGVDLALPSSIQADLIQQQKTYTKAQDMSETQATEINLLSSSEQNKGLIFGIWGMLTKLALALSIGLSFPVIDWLQNHAIASSHYGLLFFYATLPIVLKAIAWRQLGRLRTSQNF